MTATPDTIPGILRAEAQRRPDQPFLKCAGGPWRTVLDLDQASDRVAAGLFQLGVQPGDRVAILLPNGSERVDLFFACTKIGAIQVPLNSGLKGEFLRYQLADSGAGVLVTDAAGLEAAGAIIPRTAAQQVVLVGDGEPPKSISATPYASLASAPPQHDIVVEPTGIASIMYTSGTTGMPKGCVLPHRYFLAAAKTYRAAECILPGDRLLTALPLFHLGGVHSIMQALCTDASLVLDAQFHASTFMELAAQEGASVIQGVAAMGLMLLAQEPREDDAAHPMRLAVFVPMSPDDQRRFEKRFATPVLAELWGQTECAPASISRLSGPRKRSSAGQAAPHVEMKIVDQDDQELPRGHIGELVLRPREADVMFREYWGKTEATVEAIRNLWHHTGDQGFVDEDGYFTFVDRKKDALRRRGENVSSLELEAAVRQHPSIVEVAASAVSSDLGEDDIKISIVLKAGAELEPSELFSFLVSSVPYYAVARYVDIRKSLPTNAVGRVMKHLLREEGVRSDMWDLTGMGFKVKRAESRHRATPYR
jgi:crotonobetaine/carnitine-CoA ligase